MNFNAQTDLRILNESDITPDFDNRIRHTLTLCFPHRAENFKTHRWLNHNCPDFTVVVDHHYTIVAHLAVVERMITVGPSQLKVAGVALVGVDPNHRGQGVSTRILRYAMMEAERRGYDMGMLFCQEKVKNVYERHGWKEIQHRYFAHMDNGHHCPLPDDRLRMYFPLHMDDFPEGNVDLDGTRW